MKVHVNETYVRRRSSIGKWASLAGLVILLSGMFITFRWPGLMALSWISLMVGLLISLIGAQFANQFTRPDRPDAVLAEALKGLENRYAMYSYLLPPATHLLLEPGGLTALVLKHQDGEIRYDGKKWRRPRSFMRMMRWMGETPLGAPLKEAERAAEAVETWLSEELPELELPVRGAVVFTNARADLVLDEPVPEVLTYKQVKGWLRREGKRPPLAAEVYERVAALLNEVAQVE